VYSLPHRDLLMFAGEIVAGELERTIPHGHGRRDADAACVLPYLLLRLVFFLFELKFCVLMPFTRYLVS
jgi:hypothetical protein